jgi:hypothetical protein
VPLDLAVWECRHAVGQMWVDRQQGYRVRPIDLIECVNPAMLVCVAEGCTVIVSGGIDETQHLMRHRDGAVEVPLALKRFGQLLARGGFPGACFAREEDIDVVAVRFPRLCHLEQQWKVGMERSLHVLGLAAWGDQLDAR